MSQLPLHAISLHSPYLPICRTAALAFLLCILGACERGAEPLRSTEVAHGGIQSAALSDEGQLAVIGAVQHGGSLWRTDDGERLYDWNHAADEDTLLLASDISANGRWALTADVSTLVLWDTSSGASERFWAAPGKILSASLDRDATRALLGLATELAVVFDIRRGGILHSLRHNAPVTSVALSDDGRLALTGSEDGTVKLWNLDSGEVHSQSSHQDAVQLVALSPDGSLALSVSKYDKALLWRTSDGSTVGEVPLGAEKLKRGARFTAAKISANNRLLLTGRTGNQVELWEIGESLQQLQQWRLPKRKRWQPGSAAVLDVSFSGDGAGFWAVASNGFIHLLPAADTKRPGD